MNRAVGVLLGAVLAVGSAPVLTGEAVADAPALPRSVGQPTGDDTDGLTEAEALAKAKETGLLRAP